MMNQLEAAGILLQDLPELAQSFSLKDQSASIYQMVQAFVQLTCVKVQEHNYEAAKQCFAIADRLHEHGNHSVRCAIENVFVFSLDSIFSQAKKGCMDARGLVPGSLYTIYMQQVTHTGC